ncbi:protein PLASTID MOVEMENT IMPAIRED 2-like [Primulina tabacum]|uniref:protein PLASTID MOVEMENT IMPAIRED 2-like n=1 Tax=Primulina tabacum TaxID=48773 RepID=UPI003F5A01E0
MDSGIRAGIGSNGGRGLEATLALKNIRANYPESLKAETRELHQARRRSIEYNQSRKHAESVIQEAESELSAAKATANEISRRVEESNARAKTDVREAEKLRMDKIREGEWSTGNSRYTDVMSELESIKRELSTLKLDMTSLLQERRRAEQEIDSSTVSMQHHSSTLETVKREIEEIEVEHVLVELATIEAIKDCGEVEAQRKESSERFKAAKEDTVKKKKKIIKEIENAKELENKLAITLSDITLLQGGLNLVKKMERRVENIGSNFLEEGDQTADQSMLFSITKELEATKKELASVRDDSFRFMTSMDVVRNELRHVMEETARVKKSEQKTEVIIPNLHSKLLKAKTKLEATSVAEYKANSIVSNLSLTLEQLKSESEKAKNELSLISEETEIIKADVQKTEMEIELAEERLQAALQDLKAIKASESKALDNLEAQIEITIRNRASASKRGSTITISKFEYEYLIGSAIGAKEIADKKVSAAHAWIEALKACEKEIMIKTELSRRESRELKVQEEREVRKTERLLSAKKVVEKELGHIRQKSAKSMEPEILRPANALRRKSMNRSFRMSPGKKAMSGRISATADHNASVTPRRISATKDHNASVKSRRISATTDHNASRVPSFRVKRRKQIIPNLTKFFGGKSNI